MITVRSNADRTREVVLCLARQSLPRERSGPAG
jgi:hypothetical protein